MGIGRYLNAYLNAILPRLLAWYYHAHPGVSLQDICRNDLNSAVFIRAILKAGIQLILIQS